MISTKSKVFLIFLILILLSVKYSFRLESKSQLPQEHRIKEMFNNLPLYFVENKGQVNESLKYHLKMPNVNVYFTSEEIVFQFFYREDEGNSNEGRLKKSEREGNKEVRVENIRMRFVGANKGVKIDGLEESEAKVSYFRGNDPQKWVKGARTYHKLIYRELYPHIDLLVDGSAGQIKHEYRVRVGGDVDEIAIRYEGMEQLKVNERGQLEINIGEGVLKEDLPLSYQLIKGKKVEVKTEYVVEKENTIRFKIEEYKRNRELVIDPFLFYSTYLGGSGADYGYGIAVDGSGNAYITGGTISSDFPTTSGAYDTSINGNYDAFISKINTTGTSLLYSTYLGGSSADYGYGIAVDGSGNAYVAGQTYSINFPITSGAFDTSFNGSDDAFISKINTTGTSLLYSTFLGGSGSDYGYGIAVDGSGNAYVTGEVRSSDFPTTSGAYDISSNGWSDGFITKVNATGTSLLYSTYLGGSNFDYGYGVSIDANRNTYVTGYTNSSDFPTTSGAYDTSYNGYEDSFITKINITGTNLLYSTYLGGNLDDEGWGIIVDGSGNAYVTGFTYSSDFPTTSGAYDTSLNGYHDAFITKINTTGTSLFYSSFLGGGEDDFGYGIAVDGSRNAYIYGYTLSSDFPTTSAAYDTSLDGYYDAFITKINTTGTSLLYSTYLGGSNIEYGYGIAVDRCGNAYVAGHTYSDNFPTTAGAFDTSHNGSYDVSITKLLIPYPLPIFDGHDFTGNGRSDISVWRPSNGGWYIKGQAAQGWGASGDIPVNGDYNGDNVTDIAVWRPSNGRWFVKGQTGTYWGASGDIPVPGDYNGDGATDYVVWRPANGRWFVKGQTGTFWGAPGDIPVPGDYNKDGVTDYAVWRPTNGRWYVKGQTGAFWGTSGDIPVPGDYNGDGKTDYAVWRPSNGRWFVKGQTGAFWGASGDIPVPGDYNGDGVTDYAVWRPSNGRWYIKGQTGAGWGTMGDIPLVR